MPMESSAIYQELQDIITSEIHGIPVSCLETRYKEKFQRSLDYNSLGVKTIEDLLYKMCDEDMVILYKHEETNDQYVTWAHWVDGEIPPSSSEDSEEEDIYKGSSVVYKEIQDVLASFFDGIPVSCLSWLEKRYQQEFSRSLDYASLGVENIQELIDKMVKEGRALLCEDSESKRSYVLCADLVESLQKVLKRNVEELLIKHGGEIPLSSFDREYKDEFKAKLKYRLYGLTGFDHLCKVLNLVVEGKNVKKAGKIENSEMGNTVTSG